MDDVDLRGKHFVTFGKKNTGKSYFNEWLMANVTDRYVCFDPMREHNDHHPDDLVIEPTETRGESANEQLADVVEFTINNRDKFGYLWVDEVNRFHSKGGTLDGPVGDLIDLNAHYGLGVGMIARRPVQIHTDIRELADYVFIFKLTGVSDIRNLDDMARGLGERVASLDRREWITLFPDGSYKRMGPVKDKVTHRKGI